jgi:Flp pilus assembly protein TadB
MVPIQVNKHLFENIRQLFEYMGLFVSKNQKREKDKRKKEKKKKRKKEKKKKKKKRKKEKEKKRKEKKRKEKKRKEKKRKEKKTKKGIVRILQNAYFFIFFCNLFYTILAKVQILLPPIPKYNRHILKIQKSRISMRNFNSWEHV